MAHEKARMFLTNAGVPDDAVTRLVDDEAFDDLEAVSLIRDEDLRKAGVVKDGLRRRIMAAVDDLLAEMKSRRETFGLKYGNPDKKPRAPNMQDHSVKYRDVFELAEKLGIPEKQICRMLRRVTNDDVFKQEADRLLCHWGQDETKFREVLFDSGADPMGLWLLMDSEYSMEECQQKLNLLVVDEVAFALASQGLPPPVPEIHTLKELQDYIREAKAPHCENEENTHRADPRREPVVELAKDFRLQEGGSQRDTDQICGLAGMHEPSQQMSFEAGGTIPAPYGVSVMAERLIAAFRDKLAPLSPEQKEQIEINALPVRQLERLAWPELAMMYMLKTGDFELDLKKFQPSRRQMVSRIHKFDAGKPTQRLRNPLFY